jgi:two-component system, cell cycle sensor histidine kinase and response regulator CckA
MATILIVDDVSANRKFLSTLLSSQGHRVVEATNGRDALAVTQTEPPSLVITDVLMPVMDGYEFVRQLRLDPSTSRIPVLFYTAPYGEREARLFARSSDIPYVLTKPGRPDEVLEIVGRVLSAGLEAAPLSDRSGTREANRDHLRLLTDELSEKAADLKEANARLRALVNIGLDLASAYGSGRLLQCVCEAACDLFGATYVTLGIVDQDQDSVRRFATYGTDAADWMQAGDVVSGLLRTVVIDGETVRLDNEHGDPIALGLPTGHPPAHAVLAVPIASRAHGYGWLCLVSNEGTVFAGRDEPMVLALAGQVGRIYELEYEILERKQAEAALREERNRAQSYLDAADVVLLALDLDGRITLMNRHGCRLLGWTEAELLGREWTTTCLSSPDREAVTASLAATRLGLTGDDPTIAMYVVLTRTGEQRLIEWRRTVLRDSCDAVIGTLSSGSDITDRHRSAEALRLAEERMRYALDTTGVGIWDMDIATGIVRWSETLELQYGLQPGTFRQTYEAFVEQIHPDDRASALEAIQSAMASGSDFSILHRVIRPDGSVRWHSGAGRFRLDERGAPVSGVGISQDVTERRMRDEQQQQGRRMEAVGRLTGGVAHDFNNLLTAILGYCELLTADMASGDPHLHDISEIQRAGTSAASLVRQLLAFSRKQIIEPTRLDLNRVVADMEAILGRVIREDVHIIVRLQAAHPIVVADRSQIEQIIMNLAVNARDAMPGQGTLTIETSDIELDANYAATHLSARPGPHVVLTVSDTGTGMTPDVQAHLFEPFFTTKEYGKGTGLGLAMVQGIVAQNGGSISVYSEVGTGTSFNVYFPRADHAELAAHALSADSGPYVGTETVLVVEDAPGLRKLTKRLLEKQGYAVIVASSAEEALRVFDQHGSIDLLLTDVVMPGASGPELTQRLVERWPALKVVFMSGYTEAAILHDGILNPGVAFLHKPFTSETLGRKLREVLDRLPGPAPIAA